MRMSVCVCVCVCVCVRACGYLYACVYVCAPEPAIQTWSQSAGIDYRRALVVMSEAGTGPTQHVLSRQQECILSEYL